MNPQKSPGSAQSRHWRNRVTCLALHILLVVVHLALFVVISRHYEHAATFPITHATTTWIPLAVGAAQQAFATVYTAALVLVTQRLALRAALRTRQTLTAVHDKSAAWLGLGAALDALWQQTKLRAAPGGVALVTLYLLCVFALHISVPSLFHVVPANVTTLRSVQTTLVTANFTPNMVSAYDALLSYNQIAKVGLLDNIVYDILPQTPGALGNASVNASIYEVQCMALPNIVNGNIESSGSTPTSFFRMDETDATISLQLPYYQAVYSGYLSNITKSQASTEACDQTSCWSPIILASTAAIVDSSGAQPPTSSGNPWTSWQAGVLQPIIDSEDHQSPLTVLMTSVQMVACVVDIRDMQINVSATSLQPINPPPAPTEASWETFSWPQNLAVGDPRLLAAQNAPAFSPASGHENAIQLSYAYIFDLNSSQITGPAILSPGAAIVSSADQLALQVEHSPAEEAVVLPRAFDRQGPSFVSADLNIASRNRTNITLAELNRSVAKALATVHWYGQSLAYSNASVLADGLLSSPFELDTPRIIRTSQTPITEYGQTTIMVAEARYCLNLSLAPLIVGIVASIILLLLAILLIRSPSSSNQSSLGRADIDSAGILQITWLLGNEPHISSVAHPELEALRTAGMFDLDSSEHEKVYNPVDGSYGSLPYLASD
ncbi:hypothetical protein PsYK624_151940 [Phanerochaete sordida]|uniref:Uncharacterized protein n=1 Tax=Phanerochaete sordida TaxID=48140 RepID=A0A9P3GQE0_9APHY|nr:hypothetical protein PsYK624_151940 [Phanerochaete sordida]